MEFFRGKMSLRSRGEWLVLGITLAFAPAIAFVVGRVWHEVLGVSSAAVLIVVAMVYITIARGALLGSCVMIGKEQFPEVFAVVGRCAAGLDLSMPIIFSARRHSCACRGLRLRFAVLGRNFHPLAGTL